MKKSSFWLFFFQFDFLFYTGCLILISPQKNPKKLALYKKKHLLVALILALRLIYKIIWRPKWFFNGNAHFWEQINRGKLSYHIILLKSGEIKSINIFKAIFLVTFNIGSNGDVRINFKVNITILNEIITFNTRFEKAFNENLHIFRRYTNVKSRSNIEKSIVCSQLFSFTRNTQIWIRKNDI